LFWLGGNSSTPGPPASPSHVARGARDRRCDPAHALCPQDGLLLSWTSLPTRPPCLVSPSSPPGFPARALPATHRMTVTWDMATVTSTFCPGILASSSSSCAGQGRLQFFVFIFSLCPFSKTSGY
jgi:hypothetical protein